MKDLPDEDYEHKAARYYRENTEKVRALVAKATYAYRPDLTDLYQPDKWTAGHWRWFLKRHNQL